jgi:hypothetical protein
MANKPDIKGLNLDIDPAIQKICEVSNDTSSSTRGVLYILVIVCILSLISFVNTRPANWSAIRLEKVQDSMLKVKAGKCTDCIDSSCTLEHLRQKENALIRNGIENYQTVRVPILGNTFDINDLNIIAGITFLILLFILRFTIMREINNLKIALQAITERYANGSNKSTFQDYIDSEMKKTDVSGDDILSEINFIRRKHHYNFLSMNEIFTLPPLEVDDKNERNTFFGWVVNKIYWLPAIVYLLILLNDLFTIKIGLKLHLLNTIVGLLISIVCIVFIASLCRKCSRQKRVINSLYNDFKVNNYIFIKKSLS